MILNKSDACITNNQKLLLLKGFNFAPTPKWSRITEDIEWLNLKLHIRRLEWTEIFKKSDEADQRTVLPKTLCIPKFNRPKQEYLNEEIINYTERANTKLRNLAKSVKDNFNINNNLTSSFRTALTDLTKMVKNLEIVICKSHKDENSNFKLQ